MKKIILSLVLVLGMTTMSNAESNETINESINFELLENSTTNIEVDNTIMAFYESLYNDSQLNMNQSTILINAPFGYCKVIAKAIGGLLGRTGMNSVVIEIIVDALEKICKELA